MTDELVSPLNEIFHVRRVCVAAIMLAPCKLAVRWSSFKGGIFAAVIVPFDFETLGAKQRKHPARVYRSP